ncbi:MAG: hypothetical protein V2A72_05135, partial [Candidatus Omnitrophota bacterium]
DPTGHKNIFQQFNDWLDKTMDKFYVWCDAHNIDPGYIGTSGSVEFGSGAPSGSGGPQTSAYEDLMSADAGRSYTYTGSCLGYFEPGLAYSHATPITAPLGGPAQAGSVKRSSGATGSWSDIYGPEEPGLQEDFFGLDFLFDGVDLISLYSDQNLSFGQKLAFTPLIIGPVTTAGLRGAGKFIRVRHFTDEAGIEAIEKAGKLKRNTFVTKSNIFKNSTSASAIEEKLVLNQGRGKHFIDLTVKKSDLYVPGAKHGGSVTRAGIWQRRLRKGYPVGLGD